MMLLLQRLLGGAEPRSTAASTWTTTTMIRSRLERSLWGTLVSIGRRSLGPNRGAVGIVGAGAGGPDGAWRLAAVVTASPMMATSGEQDLGPWGLQPWRLGALVPSSAATGVARCPVRVWASRCMQLASLLAKESIVGGLAGETGLVLLRGELVWRLVARLMMHSVWWCWLGLEGSRAVHASSWSRSLPQHVRAQEKRILGCRRRMDALCPGEVRPVPCALWKKPFNKTRWTRDATQC